LDLPVPAPPGSQADANFLAGRDQTHIGARLLVFPPDKLYVFVHWRQSSSSSTPQLFSQHQHAAAHQSFFLIGQFSLQPFDFFLRLFLRLPGIGLWRLKKILLPVPPDITGVRIP